MAKKKQEKKEEEKLEVTSKPKGDEINIKFGDFEASLNVEAGILEYISIHRHMLLVSSHLGVFGEKDIQKVICMFKKIIAIYDALNVLKGA